MKKLQKIFARHGITPSYLSQVIIYSIKKSDYVYIVIALYFGRCDNRRYC